MITDALFAVFEAVANMVLGLIPTISAPDLSGWVAGLQPLWNGAGWLNKYVPLDQAATALGIIVAGWLVLYLLRVGVWILTKMHVLGGN